VTKERIKRLDDNLARDANMLLLDRSFLSTAVAGSQLSKQ
jgi:hypothetical protein